MSSHPSKPMLVAAGAFAALLVGGPSPDSLAQEIPDAASVVGVWTPPFEEGGAAQPRCQENADGRIICKPTAVNTAVLKDGRVLYINGLEGTENSEQPSPLSISPQSGSSRSRLLDLRSGTPQFSIPTPETGGAPNPLIREGQRSEDDPFGMAGVPGRPGDGLVGSVAGQLGLPEKNPTSPPDDDQDNDEDFFCSDLVNLADGRILDVGGTDWYNEPRVLERAAGDEADVGSVELEGLRSGRLFDPDTDTWRPSGSMKYGRWYPGLVVLPDGKVFVASGTTKLIKSTQASQVRRTETYDPHRDEWTENHTGSDSENSLPQMPRLMLMPNGKILYNGVGQMWGPFGQAADEALYAVQQMFDPVSSEWEITGLAPLGARSGAFEVMLPLHPPYGEATVMDFGGTLGPPPGGYIATPFATLTTVTATGEVRNLSTGDLNIPRWFPSGVLLPDGQVMAVGGADRDEVVDPGVEIAVHTPELYDPRSGTWRKLSDHVRDRTYHNSALLLPDGRVLLGGHSPLPAHLAGPNKDQGPVFANNDKDPSFEVYSPPYLFRGERPRITGVQAGIDWGERFPIASPHAGEIESVVLMRMPSPQHVVDSDQRMLYLEFGPGPEGGLEAVAPPHGVVAPPGYYYLFVNRRTSDGPVPSVARIVRLGGSRDLSEALQPFPDDAPAPIGGSATKPDDTTDLTAALEQADQAVGDVTGAAGDPAAAPRPPAGRRPGAGTAMPAPAAGMPRMPAF